MYLNYPMTSLDHLIEGSCKFMDVSSLWHVIALKSLVTISTVIVEV